MPLTNSFEGQYLGSCLESIKKSNCCKSTLAGWICCCAIWSCSSALCGTLVDFKWELCTQIRLTIWLPASQGAVWNRIHDKCVWLNRAQLHVFYFLA